MFGLLKPALGHVSTEARKLYYSCYCNTCAALSASGAGALNRFFLVNDVVTVQWLLTPNANPKEQPFACKNCVKGGAIGKKDQITPLQTFVAALSSYVIGIKIKDNQLDDPKFKHKLLAKMYHPVMKKAKKNLLTMGVLDSFEQFVSSDRKNETNENADLGLASGPTEACYAMATQVIGEKLSDLPKDLLGKIGAFFGRSVYLMDCMKDIEADRQKGDYNVLNLLKDSKGRALSNHEAIAEGVKAIRHAKINLSEEISALSGSRSITSVSKKLDSIFISIGHQLKQLVKPLKDKSLTQSLNAFMAGSFCQRCQPKGSKLGLDPGCDPMELCPCKICCGALSDCCCSCPCCDPCSM